MSFICKCGHREEGFQSQVAAEVAADQHESKDIRRSYRHNTIVMKEAK